MRLVTDLDENGNKSAPDPIGTLRTPYSNANRPHFDPDHTRLQSASKPAMWEPSIRLPVLHKFNWF